MSHISYNWLSVYNLSCFQLDQYENEMDETELNLLKKEAIEEKVRQ